MSPNVLPRFTATPTFYRGQPLAVLAASDAAVMGPTPGAHQVPLHVRTAKSLADEHGFRLLDRFLTSAPQLLESSFVVYGLGGITFEAGGTGVNIVGGNPPTPEWQELVASQGHVLVALVAQRNASDLDLRTLLSSRRVFGGYATAIRARPQPSRYVFLGTDSSVALAPTDRYVFLDSNVLVHLEKLARGTSQEAARDVLVQALAVEISHQVVLGGFAIAELSWDRETNHWDDDRAASLEATIDAWFGAGSITRALDLESVQSAYVRASATPRPPKQDRYVPLEVTTSFYICLLKITELWQTASLKFSAVQRVDLYEEFVRWVMEEFGYNLSFPLRIAYDRLVGPQDGDHTMYIGKLMKFGKHRPLDVLWSAAWDLAHLANVDLSADPDFRRAIGPRSGGVLLVTDDNALPLFRERLSVRAAMRDGDYSLFVMASTSEVDKRIRDQEHRLVAIESWLQQATLARQVGTRSLADWEILRRAAEVAFLSGPTPQSKPEDSLESSNDKNSWTRRVWRRVRWRRSSD